MLNLQDGSAIVVRRLLEFSVFWGNVKGYFYLLVQSVCIEKYHLSFSLQKTLCTFSWLQSLSAGGQRWFRRGLRGVCNDFYPVIGVHGSKK